MIDCKNDSENTHFSELNLELDLIDSREFSDTEPRLDYMLKSIESENISENTQFSEPDIELNLIAFRKPSKPEYKSVKFSKFEIKHIDFSDSEPKLGNFFKSFSQLGRVKVAKHNLVIKEVVKYKFCFILNVSCQRVEASLPPSALFSRGPRNTSIQETTSQIWGVSINRSNGDD